jgi:hypothetical protein
MAADRRDARPGGVKALWVVPHMVRMRLGRLMSEAEPSEEVR